MFYENFELKVVFERKQTLLILGGVREKKCFLLNTVVYLL